MGTYASVILVTAALFAAMILQLAAKPRYANRITGSFIVIAAIGGMFFYGYGFSCAESNWYLAVIRALISVCGMYVGKMDFGSISAAPIFVHKWVQFIFWLVHLFALYATASAAITTVGAEALKKLRLWLARRGHLHLIYGVNADSVELGKALSTQKHTTVVFVDGGADASFVAAIGKMGCVYRSDSAAVNPKEGFLRGIGIRPGSRKVTLYALRKDTSDNYRYASAFVSALQARNVQPEQTSLVVLGHENGNFSDLQITDQRYGYGYVTVFQEAGLVARLLIQQFPPCDSIHFDENAKATEDFEALLVGFGQVGQAVLRNLVMNGQFCGNTFRADVFAPNCESVSGFFSNQFENVLNQYDITFHPYDARSQQMYRHIASRGKKLKYIVLCAGNDAMNREIAEDLSAYLQKLNLQIPVYQCAYNGVRASGTDGKIRKLYHPQVLCTHQLDRMAMVINQHYLGDSPNTALENWMRCDYFSRMSSRASADFVHAMLRCAGKTQAQVEAGEWNLSETQLENLSITEHKRWCAFHYCMGFAPMSEEEFDARAALYRQQLQTDGKATIRIGKNMADRTHACLVDWDDLDALSAKENAITGKHLNYKAMDTENVLAVPELLRAAK